MCGICGIINTRKASPANLQILLKMIGRLRHRGPDSSGYYRDREVALGHTRLAIIDLDTGTQPLANEDDTIWVTFNGEIFNYLELTLELIKSGHQFKTKSDTEVIIHAYEEWGTGCFEHFNGQWALALWDTKKKEVILSRDRLGIRPLYYTTTSDKILFASEIKSLFADNTVERNFDPAGLSEIFTFWSPIAPKTAFRNIQELQPGHFAIIKNGKIEKRAYWSIDFSSSTLQRTSSEDENAKALRQSLIQASRLRFTRSDVPVGAYLSGGIDSSITSSIVSKYTQSPLKTFSIRFADVEFDEGLFQQKMVKRLGADHRDVKVTPKAIGDIFPKVIWHTERPILRTAPAPLFLLSRLVRESGYKVVVTGEGADEMLAGYDIFREAQVRHFLSRNPDSKKRGDILLRLYPWLQRSPGKAPAFAQAFFAKGLDPLDPGFSHRPRWDSTSSIHMILNPDFKKELAKTDIVEEFLEKIPNSFKAWEPLCKAQWLEMVSLLSGYILSAQGDRMLMANSVEGRFPFLDCDFVDFANNLPPRHKLLGLDEKHLLKIAFNDLIPSNILTRPKQPYRAPDAASFFYGEKIEWVEEVTNKTYLANAGIFNPKAVSHLFDKAYKIKGQRMSNTDNMRIVAILSTMLTYHHFIEENGIENINERPPEPIKIIDMVNN